MQESSRHSITLNRHTLTKRMINDSYHRQHKQFANCVALVGLTNEFPPVSPARIPPPMISYSLKAWRVIPELDGLAVLRIIAGDGTPCTTWKHQFVARKWVFVTPDHPKHHISRSCLVHQALNRHSFCSSFLGWLLLQTRSISIWNAQCYKPTIWGQLCMYHFHCDSMW